MKKELSPRLRLFSLLYLIFLTGLFSVEAQVAVPFSPRLDGDNIRVKGDITLLSNNILNTRTSRRGSGVVHNPNTAYHRRELDNHFLPMAYIDIDGDDSTFSSSSAELYAPVCSRVIYAGLYWGGSYPINVAHPNNNINLRDPIDTNGTALDYNRDQPYEWVKFKVPGGNYVDIGPTSDPIFEYERIYDKDGDLDRDGVTDPGVKDIDELHSPYLNYANVTHLLTALGENPNGEYTIGNVVGTLEHMAGGSFAGWTLVVIYENPNLTSKYISTYDGFAGIFGDTGENVQTISHTGFRTLPSPLPVAAKIGVAAMEGDATGTGPQIQFKAASTPVTQPGTQDGFTILQNTLNPGNNFFNSTITDNSAYVTTRNPASTHTMGWDTDISNLSNPSNSVLPNDETDAQVKILLTRGNDRTYLYLNTISVEIIAPEILVEKRVNNTAGDDITDQGVTLNQDLFYELTFKNIGNEDATNFTIRDVLPQNVNFIGVDTGFDTGVSHTYNGATREVIFTIPDNLINAMDPEYTVTIHVRVANDCADFTDACSGIIENLAFSTYQSIRPNSVPITNDPSFSSLSSCGLPNAGTTNFLLDDIPTCDFTRNALLCGDELVLTAGQGFDTYTWYRDENGNNQIDGGDTPINDGNPDNDAGTLLVTTIGTYMVNKQAPNPCLSLTETIVVERFGTTQTNPIIDIFNHRNGDSDQDNDIQGEVVSCSVDGDLLPNLFLCGSNAEIPLQLSITDADSISWQRLDDSSCADSGADCANKNLGCTWNTITTGSDYITDTAGEYRLVINYNAGCSSRFYFNVFQNNLDIIYNESDIVCTAPGNITITNLGSNYLYQLYNISTNSVAEAYSINNDFSIDNPGEYRVDIVQRDPVTGDPIDGACVFTTGSIGIQEIDINVDITTTQANCNIGGNINIQATNVSPNYTYELWLNDGTPPPALSSPDPYLGQHPGGTLVDDAPTEADNNFDFANVNIGDYFVVVHSAEGCVHVQSVSVTEVPDITLSAITTAHIGCAAGTITLSANGGFPNPNYLYAIWSKDGTPWYTDVSDIPASAYQVGNPIFTFGWRDTDGDDVAEYFPGEDGDYEFVVIDANNCYYVMDVPVTIEDRSSLTIDSITSTEPSCSGDTDGALSINLSGGVAPYQYSIDNGATYQTTPDFVNLTMGNYTVRVLDASGCDVSQPYSLNEPFPLSASAGLVSDATCDTSGGEVRFTNVIGGTGTYAYSFDGGSTFGPDASNTLLPGDYSLVVQSGSCDFPIALNVPDAAAVPNLTLEPLDYNCDGTANITITPDNPAYDYTYELNGTANTPDTSNVFTNVGPGIYTIRTYYESQTPPNPSTLLSENFGAGPTVQSPNSGYCFEPQDGTNGCLNPAIEINDGEYAVTSTIERSFGGSWRNPNDSNGLVGGRFMVINIGAINSGEPIFRKEIRDIIPNRPITVSLELFNLVRSGRNLIRPNLTIQLRDASDTVVDFLDTGDIPENTGSDNWINRSISLDPGAATELDLVVVTNETGTHGNDLAIDDIRVFQNPEVCAQFVDTPVVVETGRAFSASTDSSAIINNISCNGADDGSITFEVENFDAVAGFEYSVGGGAFVNVNSSPVTTAANLGPGLQRVDIRKADDTSCTASFEVTLTEPAALMADADVSTELSCTNGGATITASASGGVPGYTYQLEDDSNNVIGSYDFATNGNNTSFTGLAAGDYLLHVLDANGCPADFAITVDPADTVAFDGLPSACYDGSNNGSITVNVISGNGNYRFRIDGGPWLSPGSPTDTSFTFQSLVAGDYDIEVRDGLGCPSPLPAPTQVTINAQLTANADLDPDLICGTDATVTVNANGGTGTYTYAWGTSATGPWNTSNFTGNVYTTNAAGTYFFRVSDDTAPTACEVVTNSVQVTPAVPPVINSVTPTDLTCNGDNSGALAIDIDTGVGLAPFTINVENTSTSTPYGDRTSGLPAGNYTVTVTDAKNCTATATTTIAEPNSITYTTALVPITCNPSGGTDDGSITISATTGGTAEYTYTLTANNGMVPQTHTTTPSTRDHIFTVLSFGIYQVDVVDSNGCSAFSTRIIASPPDDLNIDVTALTADCATGGTAEVTVDAPVLGNNYMFGILDQLSLPYSGSFLPPDTAGGPTRTFTNLVPGVTYTFVVHDVTTDCYYFEEADAPIDTPSNMTATLDQVANVSCTGADDGNISFTFQGYDAGATDVTYEIYNAQSNATTGFLGTAPVSGGPVTISNLGTLPPGAYYLLLTEVGGGVNGCTAFGGDFTVRESVNALDLDLTVTKNDNCTANAGTITANGRFGTGPYEYQLVASGGTAPTAATWAGSPTNVFNVEGGDHDVYVKDDYGCIHMESINVPTDPSPNMTVALVDECAADGAFSVEVTLNIAGVGPYALSVNGNAFQNAPLDMVTPYTVTGLSVGAGQTITLRDVNGCTDTETYDILPKLQATATRTKLRDCITTPNAEFTLEVLAGSGGTAVGNYEYEVTGPTVAASQTRTALPANPFVWGGASEIGAYTVNIYDTGVPSCPPLSFTLEVDPELTPVLTVDAFTDETCPDANDGSITVSAIDNGIGPITFSITARDGAPFGPIAPTNGTDFSATFTGLEGAVAGHDYTITARSTTNNCSSTIDREIRELPAITVDPVLEVQYACGTGNNRGNASLAFDTASGGTGTFVRFEFIRDDGLEQDGTNPTYVDTDGRGGTYTINVYDENGCSGSTTATIDPYLGISDPVVTTDTEVSCSPGDDAIITVGVTFSDSSANPNMEYTVTGLNVTYNQTFTSTANSQQFSNLVVGYDPTTASYVPGDYSITITNLDTGCVLNTVHTIATPDAIAVIATKLSDEECLNNGTDDGSVQVTVNNYPDNYDYQVFDNDDNPVAGFAGSGNGSTTLPAITGLPAGVYYVRVTETQAPFCEEDSNTFTITAPDAPISATIIEQANVSCSNDQGSLLVDPQGGEGPYDITVTSPAQNFTENRVAAFIFDGLSAGTFNVTVTDAFGCVFTDNITLIRPDDIVATITKTDVSCFNGTDGSLTVALGPRTSPTAPVYEYNLIRYDDLAGSNPQTSAPVAVASGFPLTLNGISAGFYRIRVADDTGCNDETDIIEVENPSEVFAQLIRTSPLTCNTGVEFELSASGGSGSYEYSADNVTFIPMTGNSVDLPTSGMLDAGIYRYYLRDAVNGCIAVLSNEIEEDEILPVSVDVDENAAFINCNGDTTAIIYAQADGGVGDYRYELYNSATTVPANRIQGPFLNGEFNDLGAGTYWVHVTSGDDCSLPAPYRVVIAELVPLDYTEDFTPFASCNGESDGSITLSLSGGVGDYIYAISPNLNQFSTENTFTDLPADTYTVIGQDGNGCTIVREYTIEDPDVLEATATATAEVCAGDMNGVIDLTIAGGTAPYSTRLSSETDFVTDRLSITGLPAGAYIILIQDINGCETNITAIVDEGVNLNAAVTPVYDCSGDTPNNYVKINLEDPTVLGDILYALDSTDSGDMQLNPDFRDIAPGAHYITIGHSNGCVRTLDFEVENFEPLTLALEQRELNVITALASGGKEGYFFTFNGEATYEDNTFRITQSDTYTVTVTDENGCMATAEIEMAFIDIEIPNFFTPNGDGQNDYWAPRNMEAFPEILTVIFDRYGREVYQVRLGDNPWDGAYQQTDLPSGDYWYIMKLNGEKDQREFVGHFTLYR